uniref:ERYTHROCYTE MEMBRANE PROTEIN PFEMP3 n=1 Tax=Strongyloides papillosus TaxID=174720 RepID=A0A0N5BF83_STREA
MKIENAILVCILLFSLENSLCNTIYKREISNIDNNYIPENELSVNNLSSFFEDNIFLKGIITMVENVSKILVGKKENLQNINKINEVSEKKPQIQDTKTEVLNEPIHIKGSNKEDMIENYKKIFNKKKDDKNNEDKNVAKFSMSIDEAPETKEETIDKDSDLSYLVSKEHWEKLLFGPTGLFTEIMKQFKEIRKHELAKAHSSNTHSVSDSVNSQVGSQKDPFSKIVEAIFSAPKDKEFNEPLPELPLIGVCNRLNCGQIYNAIDSFRKSEMFSNIQTAFSLMGDEKGLDMLSEFMSNPQLISQFTSGGGETLAKILGFGGTTSSSTTNNKAIKEDGLGTDLSELIDANGNEIKFNKQDKTGLPEIAENIDYYSSVDKEDEKIEGSTSEIKKETVTKFKEEEKNVDYYEEVNLGNTSEEKKDIDIPSTNESSPTTSSKLIKSSISNNKILPNKKEIVISELPEISANIDEYGETFEKVENVDISNKMINHTLETTTSVISTTQKLPLITGKSITNRVKPKNKQHTRRSSPKPMPERRKNVTVKRTTKIQTTTIPTTTRRNFRKDSDYYSMYYDDKN